MIHFGICLFVLSCLTSPAYTFQVCTALNTTLLLRKTRMEHQKHSIYALSSQTAYSRQTKTKTSYFKNILYLFALVEDISLEWAIFYISWQQNKILSLIIKTIKK